MEKHSNLAESGNRKYHFHVRVIQRAKLMEVLEVYRQCEDFLELGPVPKASLAMVERDFIESQQAGRVYSGICDPHKNLIGIVDYLPGGFQGSPAQAFIELLMIAKNHRNQGLGRQVLAWVEKDIARTPTVQAICVAVQVNNPGGQRFWRSCGYVVIGAPEWQPDGTFTYPMRKAI